jgi:hypothetical protein
MPVLFRANYTFKPREDRVSDGELCYPKCGTQTDFKGYAAEIKLLNIVGWWTLNRESKYFYRYGITSPFKLIVSFSVPRSLITKWFSRLRVN